MSNKIEVGDKVRILRNYAWPQQRPVIFRNDIGVITSVPADLDLGVYSVNFTQRRSHICLCGFDFEPVTKEKNAASIPDCSSQEAWVGYRYIYDQ